MNSDKNIYLSSKPLLPWKPVPWKNIPHLPWPHKMINLAESWGKFYPCKNCGFCCKNPPLIKIENGKAYYLPRNELGYCIMYDEEKRLCKIHEKRPLECRLFVCKAPQSFKERMEKLLIKFLKEYSPVVEKHIEEGNTADEIGKLFEKAGEDRPVD